MLELIILRHGETDSNVKGTYLGWTDISLNQKGVFQAYRAGEKLNGIKVDGIYSSPLKRAVETAEIINENFGMEIQCTDSLKERNFGQWDDLTYSEITCKYPVEHELWINDWIHYCIKDGESAFQTYQVNTSFIMNLKETKKKGTYIIVTHLGCIRNIFSYLLGLGIEGAWHFKVDNTGICRIEINDEGFAYITAFNV